MIDIDERSETKMPTTKKTIISAEKTKSNSVNHRNNFDFLRITAALAVLIVHHYALMKLPEPGIYMVNSWAGIAVYVFFVISGFLVTQSWFADSNSIRFTIKRFLRIWPALTIVVLVAVFIIGPIATNLSVSEYFRTGWTWDYLKILYMEFHSDLPGVFRDNPNSTAVNGSLWSIPEEVRCYLYFIAFAAFGLLRKRTWLAFWIVVYMIWYISKGLPDVTGNYHRTRELSAYFLLGSFMFCTKTFWKESKFIVFAAAMTAWAIIWFGLGWKYFALLVTLPVTIILFGSLSTPGLRSISRWGDPSYGLYLWAFPIQQLILWKLFDKISFLTSLTLAIAATAFLAYLSWHIVEKPMLTFKPRHQEQTI